MWMNSSTLWENARTYRRLSNPSMETWFPLELLKFLPHGCRGCCHCTFGLSVGRLRLPLVAAAPAAAVCGGACSTLPLWRLNKPIGQVFESIVDIPGDGVGPMAWIAIVEHAFLTLLGRCHSGYAQGFTWCLEYACVMVQRIFSMGGVARRFHLESRSKN